MKVECSEDSSLIINAALLSHKDHWEKIYNAEDYLMRYKKPYDTDDAKKQMQSWMSNFNYGKGKMIVEQGVISNIVDIFKAIGMIEIEFKPFNKRKHKKKIYEFLKNEYVKYVLQYKIASLYAEILEYDPRIHSFLAKIEYNSFCFGYCPIVRDKFCYLGKPISLRSVAFEDRTPIDDIKNFVIFDVIKGEAILEKYEFCKKHFDKTEDIKVESKTRGGEYSVYSNGWVKEGMEEIYFKVLSMNPELKKEHDEKDDRSEFKITSWEDVEDVIDQKGMTWLNINVNNIYIAKIYTTDCGEITESYQVLNGDIGKGQTNVGVYEYLLYQKTYTNSSSYDFLNIIKEFGITDSDYIQDLKGISKPLVEESLRYDFKKNAIEDKLLVTANLSLSSPDGLTAENNELQVFGGVTYFPEGVQFMPNQIKIDLNDHIISIQQDDVEFEKRTNHYNPQIHLSNRPTKDEVQLKGQQHNSNKNAKLPFKLSDYGRLFTLIFKDLINEDFDDKIDSEMKDRFIGSLLVELEEFNINEDDIITILNEVDCVKLNPVNLDIEAIKQAMPFAQNTKGRTKLMRSLLYALGFHRSDVNQFIEVVDFGDQIEKAALENSAFYNTSEIVFDESQDHIGHLQTHFPKLDRTVKGIAGGEDIVRGFSYITNCLTNCEKHVAALENSFFFKNRFKEFNEILKYFQSKARQISLMIEEQKKKMAQEAQQQQGQGNMQIPSDELAKIKILEFKAMEKEKRANAGFQLTAQRKMKDLEDKLTQRKMVTNATIEEKKAIAELQKELEQLKASIKIANAA